MRWGLRGRLFPAPHFASGNRPGPGDGTRRRLARHQRFVNEPPDMSKAIFCSVLTLESTPSPPAQRRKSLLIALQPPIATLQYDLPVQFCPTKRQTKNRLADMSRRKDSQASLRLDARPQHVEAFKLRWLGVRVSRYTFRPRNLFQSLGHKSFQMQGTDGQICDKNPR